MQFAVSFTLLCVSVFILYEDNFYLLFDLNCIKLYTDIYIYISKTQSTYECNSRSSKNRNVRSQQLFIGIICNRVGLVVRTTSDIESEEL